MSYPTPYPDSLVAPVDSTPKMPVPAAMGMSGGRRRRRSVKKSKSSSSSKRRTTRYRKTRGGHKCKRSHK